MGKANMKAANQQKYKTEAETQSNAYLTTVGM